MPQIDETHDPKLRSWLDSANASDGDFPVQNLPLGVFKAPGRPAAVGAAIGDRIVDIAAVADRLDPSARDAADLCRGTNLNLLMAAGRTASGALRRGLSRLLSQEGARAAV